MISLLPLILAVFLLASFFRVAFVYHVLYILVAVALLARAWSTYTARRIDITRRFESRCLHGEPIQIEIAVANRGFLPVPWLRVQDRLPVALAAGLRVERVISLGPRGEASFTIDLVGRQRGWYRLGPISVELGDVLGLNLLRLERATDRHLIVHPKVVPVGALGLPSRLPFGDVRTRQRLFEDPARVAGVRDYQTGDSLRLVHWRTSAAIGRLQVRRHEPALTLLTLIALDLDPGRYEASATYYATELAIEVAASLACRLVGLRQEVGLAANAGDPRRGAASTDAVYLPPRKGSGQLTTILDVLAGVQVGPGPALTEVLARQHGALGWGATVVVVTGRIAPDLADAVRHLRRAGFSPTVVLVAPVTPYGVDGEVELGRGIPLYRVWRESDLDDAAAGEIARRVAQPVAR